MTVTPFSLAHKYALITGASGGIGASIARAFVSQGATVTLSGTRVEALNTLKNELMSLAVDASSRIHIMPCDLNQEDGMEQLIQDASKAMGGLDILINNAGITRDNLLMRMKDEDWKKVLDINLTSCFKACRAAIKSMMSKRYGKIINIASIVGVTGNPGQTNYCASKAGMIGFSKALAQEVATRNITVNCIAPGFIATQMTDVLNDGVKDKILSSIPMQRMGSPEDIANGAVFLASAAGDYITGQTLHINGGMAMV